MSLPIPFPAGQPAHPLDYWTSPELARVSPPSAPSRLRQLADAQGTLAAAWSGAIGSGPLLLLTGGFVSAVSGNPAWVLILGLLGGIAARGTSTLVAVSGAYVLFVVLLVASILLPAVVLGRARQFFRRRIQTDPGPRTAVEGDLANWRDPHGNAGYGPL